MGGDRVVGACKVESGTLFLVSVRCLDLDAWGEPREAAWHLREIGACGWARSRVLVYVCVPRTRGCLVVTRGDLEAKGCGPNRGLVLSSTRRKRAPNRRRESGSWRCMRMHLGALQSQALWVRVGGRGLQISSAPVVDGSIGSVCNAAVVQGVERWSTTVTRRGAAFALCKSPLWQKGR